jgi:hypothetical protein
MRISGLILGAAVLAVSATSAPAAMRISEDRGGQIGHYLQAFAHVRSTGERVIIDGNCLSACTLVLGLVPRHRICATSRARLGFHAAWMPDRNGRPVTSSTGTRALWRIYPASVRNWINRNGGLSRRMIFMQGNELHRFVQSCDRVNARAQARSHRRANRTLRYVTGNASGYRR